jgi:hypothetical protein
MGRQEGLLFCGQKRSKKNFESHDAPPPVPQETNKVFFAYFLFTKKKTLLFADSMTRLSTPRKV